MSPPRHDDQRSDERRRSPLAWAARILGVSVLALLVWGTVIEPRMLAVEREPAPVPNLPAEWDGARIAVLGDFQVGMWLDNEPVVADAVREIIAAEVSAVLLLGDFIYAHEGEPGEELDEVVPMLAPLVDAGIPTLAVLGNHDYGQDTEDELPRPGRAALVRYALERIAIRVLQNEVVALPGTGGGDPLYVVGIGPAWPGLSSPDVALAQLPRSAPRVVFMHNPQSFRAIIPGEAPFSVAGHTHGGQVRIPFMPHHSWLTLVRGTEAVDGWIEGGVGAPGNRLYVNRGIGFSTLPLRLNCRPELTIFTLRRGDGDDASANTDDAPR